MKKSRLVSTRLEETHAKVLDEIAKDENIDKATLVRKWILEKLQEYRLKKAAERYRRGIASLEECAKMADVSIWRFLEYVREKKIWPPPQTEEELEQEFENTKEVLKES